MLLLQNAPPPDYVFRRAIKEAANSELIHRQIAISM